MRLERSKKAWNEEQESLECGYREVVTLSAADLLYSFTAR